MKYRKLLYQRLLCFNNYSMYKLLFRIFLSFLVLSTVYSCKDQEEGVMAITPGTLSFTSVAGTQEITFVSNTGWSVGIPQDATDWCHITPLFGDGNETLSVSVDANLTPLVREATITVTYDDTKRSSFNIKQGAATAEGSYINGEVRAYEINRETKPVNMVFIGDGFIAEDFTEGGAFDAAVQEAAEAIFNVEPYKTYRGYFNMYKMAVFSAQRGATYEDTGAKRKTAFGTTYHGGSSMTTDDDSIFACVKRIPGIIPEQTGIVLIVNDSRYGGTTMMYSSGRSIAICPMNRATQLPGGFGHIVVHEGGGHGFGRLADEYTNEVKTPPTADEIKELKQWFSFGYYDNVDLTNDLTQIKWRDFVGRQGYDAVNAFEGANYHEVGVWRPETISCMDNNMYYFNAPSRAAIVKRLLAVAGETYTLEGFIAKDAVKSAPPALASKPIASDLPRLAPPVMKYD